MLCVTLLCVYCGYKGSSDELTLVYAPILQDQFDNLEKHTQWGIEYLEKYTKFVKERSEIELNYAKQIRWALETRHPTRVHHPPPPAALDAREMSLKEDMESTGYLAEESDLWSAAIGKAEIRVLILDDILRYAYT